MATIKQKSLKPSTNLPFSQGMLVYNGTGASIAADTLVSFTSGVNGAQAKVVKALAATTSVPVKGQAMLVTKHAIPDGKSGVVLPWKIIDHDTSSGFTASAAGFVYLSDTTAGAFVGSALWRRLLGRFSWPPTCLATLPRLTNGGLDAC